MGEELERVYNLVQASTLLGLKVRTVRQWVHEGKIKASKIEGSQRWIITESEIKRMRGIKD